MKKILASYLLSLILVGGWQNAFGIDIKSAVLGEWRFVDGSSIRLNAKGGFRKEEIRGSYSFVSDSIIRFEYRDSSQGKEIKTKQFFYLIRMITDSAMHVESAADENYKTKELLRLRRRNRVELNRNTIIMDLLMLAAKSQQYYQKHPSLGGGGNSFAGLTADRAGIAVLANIEFTNNINGTYTISRAGNADSVVIHGVGKVPLEDGKYPTYDIVVKPISTKINTIK